MLVRAPRLVLLAALSLGAPVQALAADAGMKPPAVPGPAATPATPPTTNAGVTPSAGAKTATTATKSATAKTGKPKTPKPPKNPPVVLFTVNHKETFSLRLRDGQGKPIKGNQKRFDKFLRCHHTEKKHAMNPRLMKVLYQTGRHWPGRQLEIVSGYRHPKVAKNPRSPHMKGLACDFRVEGVKAQELRDYLRKTYEKVGVGYYPNSTFVHVDVRKDKSAFWIDYSGPGERAVYSENPNEDLKTGRADTYKPTKIDESWASDESSMATETGGNAAPKLNEPQAGEAPKEAPKSP
jgi:uncharacterized protein YcbK (DUF882 family)